MEVRKDFWEKLRGYRGRWKGNFIAYNGDSADEFLEYLNGLDDFADFIISSFYWKGTPEGHDFWLAIANGGKPKGGGL